MQIVSTHAPLARCDSLAISMNESSSVSTHAPLARCDGMEGDDVKALQGFNSRTSCEVRRNRRRLWRGRSMFQLTHLLRGATGMVDVPAPHPLVSTHAPLARCDVTQPVDVTVETVSTHAPLARCDTSPLALQALRLFQLTHLLRGATNGCAGRSSRGVSTHAPLARCDMPNAARAGIARFQLTHLLRGATQGHIRFV